MQAIKKALVACTLNNFMRSLSSQAPLQIIEDNGVRKIILSDIKTKNSLSLNMVSSLFQAVKNNENNPKLRCIVISAMPQGRNPIFSSGFNLKELNDPNCRKVFEDFNLLMLAILRSPVPVIAAVDGLAAAAGCQLVAQCDIAVCTPNSFFSTPGANFGVFCSTPGIPLMRSIGRKNAAYMLFTGHPLTAQEALEAGLVSHVSNQLDDLVKHITDGISSKSRAVIQLGKSFLYQQIEMNISTAYEKGAEIMRKNLELDDGIEGLKSFIEKRKPVWKQ